MKKLALNLACFYYGIEMAITVIVMLLLCGTCARAANKYNGDANHDTNENQKDWVRDGSIDYIVQGLQDPFDEVGVESYSENIIYAPPGWPNPGITDGGSKKSGSSHVGVKFVPSANSKGKAVVEEVKFRVKYKKYAYVEMYEGPLDSHSPWKPPDAQVSAKAGGRISYLSGDGNISYPLPLSSFSIGVFGDASQYSIGLPTVSVGFLTLPSLSFTPDITGDFKKTIPSEEGHFDINVAVHYIVSKRAQPEFLRPVAAQVTTETMAFGSDSCARATADLTWHLVDAYPQRRQSDDNPQDHGSAFVFATP